MVTATGVETPALQTNLPAVRFVALTRTEFVPAGRGLGSCPDSAQFPLESDVETASVPMTVPVASSTWSLIPREGLQALAVLRVPYAVTFPPLLSFGLPLK
jgi:hypothetical protein